MKKRTNSIRMKNLLVFLWWKKVPHIIEWLSKMISGRVERDSYKHTSRKKELKHKLSNIKEDNLISFCKIELLTQSSYYRKWELTIHQLVWAGTIFICLLMSELVILSLKIESHRKEKFWSRKKYYNFNGQLCLIKFQL